MEHKPQHKIVIIGDGGIGKTTLVNRFIDGNFTKKYLPTVGASVRTTTFYTNIGPISLQIWDTAGQEKFGGLRDGYYIKSEGVLMMFDVTSRTTYKNIPKWYRDITRVCPDIPVVICGNKVDIKDRKVKQKNITFHRKHNLQYYDLSVRSNYNCVKPFLYIIRKIYKNPNIIIVEEPALLPQEVYFNEADYKNQIDISTAADICLSDSDSDI